MLLLPCIILAGIGMPAMLFNSCIDRLIRDNGIAVAVG